MSELKVSWFQKDFLGVLNSSTKMNEKTKQFNLTVLSYDTSGWIVFVCFLEKLRVPKSPFEIKWLLGMQNDEIEIRIMPKAFFSQCLKYSCTTPFVSNQS